MNTIKMKSKLIMFLMAGMLLANSANALAQASKASTFKSTITINGTSNIHDWHSKTDQLSGEFVVGENNTIESLVVKFPVQSIKSGDRLMDKKTYETMLSEKHPSITFQLTEPTTAIVSSTDIQINLTGNLTVAGVTKKITFKSTGKKTANGGYQLTGTVPMKMTDFKMKIPTALLGTIKAGDAVTVKFDVMVLSHNLVATN